MDLADRVARLLKYIEPSLFDSCITTKQVLLTCAYWFLAHKKGENYRIYPIDSEYDYGSVGYVEEAHRQGFVPIIQNREVIGFVKEKTL